MILALVLEPEARFVLRMVTMEVYCGLVGGGEKGRGHILATESANDSARFQRPVTYLEKIMVGLSGEVEEL